ncbi:DegT/DnrJ/EryC1/StrS family aminotransferase [Phenylobacterium sp.]|uniref:DegT/DnrJ/EryC1/StrS family aminotransferase n=1 Tax=Phenylobacterium sp. TaxID=1871053 RepID=UPI001210DD10|nr:DegT/DnrJ/EryC1/StrS family aminotransferase [Phenylobacterium sp.]TAL28420.1 MAG: DegT/DnrJ/EryC1/StrS family aminotransferase [Phenylobacterium sp.]
MNAVSNPAHVIDFAGIKREHAELADVLNARIAEVMASGQMLQGPGVVALEQSLALACGRAEAVCVGSGTDALYFALLSVGVGPGDEVIVPDISFIATAAAVARTGARPVFVDVDDACLLDLEAAGRAVTPRTKAVVMVQLFGAMSDPEALRAFGAAYGVAIIEDAAQAFGATHGEAAAGGVGLASALSFDPMKVLSAPGSGGAVLTDDASIAARVRRLRYHGREAGDYVEPGYNSQLSTLAAAVLSTKLERQTDWAARRARIAERYIHEFSDLPLERPSVSPHVRHVWHKFVLRAAERDRFMAHLKSVGVPTLAHYPRPFHREPMFGVAADGLFPNAVRHAGSTLSLPIHAHLTEVEVERIIAAVRGFFA